MKLVQVAEQNKKYYTKEFIHGFNTGAKTQYEADKKDVRHGRWIWKGEEGDSRFMCSVCHSKEYVPTCNGKPTVWFCCPNCGAIMVNEDD